MGVPRGTTRKQQQQQQQQHQQEQEQEQQQQQEQEQQQQEQQQQQQHKDNGQWTMGSPPRHCENNNNLDPFFPHLPGEGC